MSRSRAPSTTDVAAAAAEGFVFGYPLVLMNRVRAWMTAVDEADPMRMRAPPNRFAHARELPGAAVGRPAGARVGALRSSAWLDLGGGPVSLSVPETHGRWYALSLVDLWTNVFASVGARTTGSAAGSYVITGPAAPAPPRCPVTTLPIRAPTRYAWIAGATQVDGDGGCAGAAAIQDAYGLAAAPVPCARARPRATAPPVVQVERLGADDFFAELADLMRENPPRLEDWALVERLRHAGLLEPGWLGRDARRAVAAGAARGLERVRAAAEAPPGERVGGWHARFASGRFGTDYLGRAAAACAGLEPGPAEDELSLLACADHDGRELCGQRGYELTFPPAGLPPVHGFWTLTAYDAREPLVDNPVERYSIGDWNRLVLDHDGAATIRIQHGDPGPRVANWLPAPPGAFHLVLTLCWPFPEVLARRWEPPPIAALAPVSVASPDRDHAAPPGRR
jgi:hypothetical protein